VLPRLTLIEELLDLAIPLNLTNGIVLFGMIVVLGCAMAIEMLVIIVVLIAVVNQALISTKLLLDVVMNS
jgi:hypothetical protein